MNTINNIFRLINDIVTAGIKLVEGATTITDSVANLAPALAGEVDLVTEQIIADQAKRKAEIASDPE